MATATAQQLYKDWIEPAHLLISFAHRAIIWFSEGDEEVKRAIVKIVGSNYTLTDKKLQGQATKPFSLRVEEPEILYGWRFLDDIRTRFELSDPSFLKVLEQIRNINILASEGRKVS